MARLGMLVPSSNTVLEPATAALLPPERGVTTHVARIRVLRIADDASTQAQFAGETMADAAELLADAQVDLILWNGTAAGWLGFARDDAIVSAITARTGLPATTAVMALNARLAALGARRIGLVSPYVDAVERRIVENYAKAGIAITATARADRTENTSFAEITPETVAEMVRKVAAQETLDAIMILCTNMAGAGMAASLTAELGVPVLDSVVVALEHCLEMLRAA